MAVGLRDLARVPACVRAAQQQLADMVGYDRSYISMIESGRRHLTGRGTLAHIARTLVIPPHVLGIARPDDAGDRPYRSGCRAGRAVPG